MTTQTEITQRSHHRAVRFFWGLLIGATAVSLLGNIAHAVLPYLSLIVIQIGAATVPPIALLAAVHGIAPRTVVVAGEARVDAVDADPLADEQYQAKYHDYAVSIGMGDEYLAAFSTRLKVSVDKVWTTPSAQ